MVEIATRGKRFEEWFGIWFLVNEAAFGWKLSIKKIAGTRAL